MHLLTRFCPDCHWTGSLQNSWTSSYSGQSEKEINKIGVGKAGGRVADQSEADEIPARSSPGGEIPGDQSNMGWPLIEIIFLLAPSGALIALPPYY